jgi:putative bacteriocin precursor
MKKLGKKRSFDKLTVDAYMGCNCPISCSCSCNCIPYACDCSVADSYVMNLNNNGGVAYGTSMIARSQVYNSRRDISGGVWTFMNR